MKNKVVLRKHVALEVLSKINKNCAMIIRYWRQEWQHNIFVKSCCNGDTFPWDNSANIGLKVNHYKSKSKVNTSSSQVREMSRDWGAAWLERCEIIRVFGRRGGMLFEVVCNWWRETREPLPHRNANKSVNSIIWKMPAFSFLHIHPFIMQGEKKGKPRI